MPTEIYTAEELKNIENDMAGSYILMNDIDLDGGSFEPIGHGTGMNYTAFTGTFNGQGYKIHNGIINYPNDDYYIGLFAYIDGAIIKNVGVDNEVTGYYDVGGLVGRSNEHGDTNNIHNCYNTGNISGVSTIGGLFGFIRRTNITNCYSTGHISADWLGGGLCGWTTGILVDSVYEMSMSKCFSTGNVNCTYNEAGGLMGACSYMEVDTCFSTGNVTGGNTVGSFIGDTSRNIITNCFGAGDVTGVDSVGGLIGDDNRGTITNCYSTGNITATGWETGGLIGYASFDGDYPNINYCYYNEEVSGQEHVIGNWWAIEGNEGENKTTAQMKDISTFSMWDMATQAEVIQDEYGWNSNYIWGIGEENDGYPFLYLYEEEEEEEPIDPLNIWVKINNKWRKLATV